jgi:PAS domain S-box-containing protein
MENNKNDCTGNQTMQTQAHYSDDERQQTAEELYKTLHELRIYQIELEMQNRELRETREQLEESRNMYAELYDSAPVGYITLSHTGCIYESNLMAAQMLEYDRARLIGKPFVIFVDKKDVSVFFRHLQQCSQNKQASTELCLVLPGRTIYVQLSSVLVQHQETGQHLYRTVVLDMSKQKKDEQQQQQTITVEKELIINALYTEREQNKLESELSFIRTKQLEDQLEVKINELSQMSLDSIEKYEWFSSLEKQLTEALWSSPSKSKKHIQHVLHDLSTKLAEHNQWNRFEQQLGETHQKFLHFIAVTYPSLTPAELKICCLLRLNLSTKEIAHLLHTSAKTIENQRYRIRKKMNLPVGQSLTAFLFACV